MSRVLLYLSVLLVVCCVSVGGLSAQDTLKKGDAAKQPKKTPEQVFSKLDKNGDGQLDLDEFKRTSKNTTTAGEVEKLFAQADKNGDGKVSLEEFTAAKRPGKAAEKGSAAGKAPEEDLKQIQGMWTRPLQIDDSASGRVTKEVKGNVETVTYYDNEGNVQNAHTTRIKLQRAGPIRIFAYSDVTYIAGPKKGEKQEGGGAYIYKVVDDTFIEIWGVLGDSDDRIHALRWKHEKPEA
jgi:hypothetical protein